MTEEKIINLRPHHLLCTQGYSGKGYNEAFVLNMTMITKRMRTEPDLKVRIVFSTDDLCTYCPRKRGEGICADDAKVLVFDKGVKDLLDLEENEYSYQELIHEIHDKMDSSKMKQICGICEWYHMSACKKNILSGKYLLENRSN
ncbi:DUF1284 domain-containing protein [Butyrivibrio sp. AE3004]|uniref:DUF1284 domain-containing protein n=1 Tax=Butyrivibrio sp. AE3004 TaxID=1506994 RepID=UPI0004949C5B|nr:DUF1284 domain-containing protein [Butyrivibrio sp. AE3004]